MKTFTKERKMNIQVDIDKSVDISVRVVRGEWGELTISTKIGEEPWDHRETSLYNPNIVKFDKL